MNTIVSSYAPRAWRWWRDGIEPHGARCGCLPCSDLVELFQRTGILDMDPGRIRQGSTRLEMPLDEYRLRVEAGEKWCSGCQRWHPIEAFGLHIRRGLNTACEASVRVSSLRAVRRQRRLQAERRAS